MADFVRQIIADHWITFSVLLVLVSRNYIRRMLRKEKVNYKKWVFDLLIAIVVYILLALLLRWIFRWVFG